MKILMFAVSCFALFLASFSEHPDRPKHEHPSGSRGPGQERHPDRFSKRDTTVEGHADKSKDGTHVGGSITHTSGDSSVGAHVDHSNPGGTSYGVHASHTWSHGGGSKTTVSGGFDHNSHGGDSGGISVTHTFGKRLALLEETVMEMERSRFSKRDTTVEGHADKSKDGTHVGGSITHTSGDSSIGAHVDHSNPGGTSYGVHASHTWSHGGGSKTTVSGGLDHNSHGGDSGGISVTHTFGKRLALLEETVMEMERRQTTAHGQADKDKNGDTHVGGGVEHTSKDGNTHTEGHVDHSSSGGTSYGGSFSHTFGKREFREKRQTSIGGYGNKDSSGTHIGGSISHKSGSTTVGGHIDHSNPGGTSYGVNAGHTWSHGDGSKTTVSGGFDHNSQTGNNFGIGVSHTFGKRLVDLERAVVEMQRRQTTVQGQADKDKNGDTHVGGGVEHTSKDGNTHAEGHVDHSSSGGTSYGGSFSHTFGKRLVDLERAAVEMQRRQTTVHGHADKDKNGGTHVGGGVEHTSKDGNTHTEGHVDHSSSGGTSYGGSFSHTFGKREFREKRQTSIGGYGNKDSSGTHIGGSISHKSGSTTVGGHIDHSNPGGTSYGVNAGHTWSHGDGSKTTVSGGFDHNSQTGNNFGIGVSHTFGKRLVDLERAVVEMQRRQTTVHGHADKDKNGDTHVGGGVEHTSKDGNTHAEGHVDHSSSGGTSYGGSFSHTFGKREFREKRQTSIGGYGNKDSSGTHIGGSISHKSGSTTVGGHIDHSNPGGTSYGVSAGHTWSHGDGSKTTVSGGFDHNSQTGNNFGIGVSHTFGKRLVELERTVVEMQKRQTTVHGQADKNKNGDTHVGGGVEHTSKDGNTHTEGHVDHSSSGGTSYGGSFSHTFGKRLARRHA